MSTKRSRGWAALLVAFLGLLPPPALAHLAVSTRSLRVLLTTADLVVVAAPIGIERVIVDENGKESQRAVMHVEVLEVLKGPPISGDLLVAQHGHGVAQYEPGQHALLFLRRISETRELRDLGASGPIRWVSEQEHDDAYILDAKSGAATIRAAKAYLAAYHLSPPERSRALRRVTVTMLVSRDARLAESALHDLVLAPDEPLVTRQDVPKLKKVLGDSKTSIGVRVGLLSELQRRSLVSAASEWVHLLETTEGPDRVVVIRACRAHQSPPVTRVLIDWLQSADPVTASEAALALGTPGHDAAVDPLANALRAGDRRVSMATIRALGSISTPKAWETLAKAAASNEDESIRRRAAAELRRK
ncbi:MAG: HEAT repeat domain-containing protein [Polyangiales bacterium]